MPCANNSVPMEILLLVMASVFSVGLVLGLLWRWPIWRLLAVMVATSLFVGLYTDAKELPSWSAVVHNVWSFLWVLADYGPYLGWIAGSGVVGAVLGWGIKKVRRTPI